jgi:Ribonuclease G/E
MEACMAEVKDLREKMANIATEARSKLSEVTDKTPEDRAAEIEREFDAMMAEHDKLAAKVERLACVRRKALTCRAVRSVRLDRLVRSMKARRLIIGRRSLR